MELKRPFVVLAGFVLCVACTGSSGPVTSGTGGTTSGTGGTPTGTGGAGPGGASGGSSGTGGGGAIVDAMVGPDTAGGEGTDGGQTATDAPPVHGTPMEAVKVPSAGTMVSSQASFKLGDMVLLRAQGLIDLGSAHEDAKFTDFAPDGTGASETGGGIDVGGAAPANAKYPPATGADKWFGDFQADHVYYKLVIGGGGALSFKLLKAGSGEAITVSVFSLSAATPPIGASVDTVMVPMGALTTVMSKVTPAKGAVYVLQAAGTGTVGAGKKGDAEYDDFSAAGTGELEGEGGVDFGIGVDEPETKAHYPRLRKWGPLRLDHVYYMLYAGTGSAISFTYYDTAYGDNGKTDMLTATVFPAP